MNSEFAFTDFPVLQTERCTLRKATENDRYDIFELYSQEAVVKYMPFTPFISVEDAIDEMKWYDKIFKEQSGLRWMIEDRETQKVIGTCGFLNYEQDHHRVEIGYDLMPAFWGKGIMTEVVNRVMQFGFLNIRLNKIEARVEPKNEASLILMNKLGFYKEGVLRQHEFEKGRYVDLAVFSKLKSEYR
ncbi:MULTISPECIES: GNAT family N-acetyltransferase [Paenibacillus]|jgi:ribosomal-protein-alanine N-acetyltransferase|uniref:GNAT family N-acetyltransferase n=1 Tax=Paenibacillus TaxID=44249 RepID=UPI00096E1D20|nr:GNAT family protein [Paenibacillus odorifer]MEC0130777.1 GNAT family protein [Paenibacillus odorifer]MEC0220982.1 GNAT family protein [Paenibacillus odorifer]OMD08904.1 N-acetyltransferase [Paenibacillus odorifer]OMD12106.1 N-acetyltransferase [Paenibacillus odorifer]OME35517.1 N-acetyltransferase [Paenibacillus odorifer]